jgi:hypothetical protein
MNPERIRNITKRPNNGYKYTKMLRREEQWVRYLENTHTPTNNKQQPNK